ncbi:hypothetical protein [Falsiroseomonas tokyonensis]|uniref:Uncharacterized protein n=1 Tax=Falsiroseomonas tokyonensis TaxID=430521 RepID=A0ABV7C5V5_9PROT|nr:hypothetical protein [Falsiroseomonas tokyonensis]MBU8542034.1 hypothetical protein [Falsiroseomonas tokyonensis]
MSDFITTSSTTPAPTQAAPTMTPEAALQAIRIFEDGPAWRDVALGKTEAGKLGLMAERDRLYRLAYPEPGQAAAPAHHPAFDAASAASLAALGASGLPELHDPNADGMVHEAAAAAEAPAAPEMIADRLHSIAFPGAEAADLVEFRSVAGTALASIGATQAEAGQFVLAASEVAARPDAFTPESAESSLRREWGGAYDRNLGAARAALKALERRTPGLTAHLENTNLGNHPAVAKLLVRAAARVEVGR